jgi:hypothetical protein
MTGVFGIRNIMTPLYGLAVTVHAVNGVRLFLEPPSIPKLVDMFLTLQIYVWVRVMYSFIGTFATMARYQYTVSVMVAGMIIGPALSMDGGLMSNLLFLAAITVWNIIYPVLPPCCKHAYPSPTDDGDYKMDKLELGRTTFGADFLDSLGRPITSEPSITSQRHCLRRQKATFFETPGEQSDHGHVHEERPFKKLRKQSTIRSMDFISIPEAESVDPQVRELFATLCDDADVGMTQQHMERLLAVWGLPYHEAEHVFAELRPNLSNPEVISFDEFYKLLEPVWRYSISCIETGTSSRRRVRAKLSRTMTADTM